MADGFEARLFGEVGREVRQRGHFVKAELVMIGGWRSHRAMGHLRLATEQMVESISALALDTNTAWQFRDRILCVLDGVAEPLASALLTVWDPEHFTLLDRRSVESLGTLLQFGSFEEPPGCFFPTCGKNSLPSYLPYLEFFAVVADRIGVDYRSLDRALWKWHRDGMPRVE